MQALGQIGIPCNLRVAISNRVSISKPKFWSNL